MITTRDSLKEYIFRKLGAPLVAVELDEDSLDDIINDTVKVFTEFAYGEDLEATVILNVDGSRINSEDKVSFKEEISEEEDIFQEKINHWRSFINRFFIAFHICFLDNINGVFL